LPEKVKKCPNCNHINNEFAFICPECRYSLMHVEAEEDNLVSDEDQCEVPEKERPGKVRKEGKKAIRKLSSKPTDVMNYVELFLESAVPPAIAFQVKPGDIAGRDGTIDLSQLENSNFISREHARFNFKGGNWYIENLSQTNKTFVNQIQVQPEEEHILNDGDHIILANTRLIISISR